MTRRKFLTLLSVIGVGFDPVASNQFYQPHKLKERNVGDERNTCKERDLAIYRSINGSPSENIAKVIELLGGIGKIVGKEDVVIIKPNAQWWNQGAPNISAINQLIRLILDQSSFQGEVIVAENNHRGASPWRTEAWVKPFGRNSDLEGIFNFNELCESIKANYGDRFSVCHWIDAGAGNKRTSGPAKGTGYVYCDGTGGNPLISCENKGKGENYRATIMTYPIFSSAKGTIIDFKNGVWEKGSYTKQPIKFINLSALNHHSTYCGMTSAVKNYMGVTDLSGGPDPHEGGRLTKDYYNFHSFPFDKWAPGPSPGMLGREIGTFMKTIRKADLNITTAEWVGLSSRTDEPVARTRVVMASTDPVALDFHAAKYFLYPNSKISFHNPEDKNGPIYQYLSECAAITGDSLDERKVKVISYDFKKKSVQTDGDWTVMGEKTWGKDPKAIMKFLILRYLK